MAHPSTDPSTSHGPAADDGATAGDIRAHHVYLLLAICLFVVAAVVSVMAVAGRGAFVVVVDFLRAGSVFAGVVFFVRRVELRNEARTDRRISHLEAVLASGDRYKAGYCDGYVAGVSRQTPQIPDSRDDQYKAGYCDGFTDGVRNAQPQTSNGRHLTSLL